VALVWATSVEPGPRRLRPLANGRVVIPDGPHLRPSL
jgi:hypothetical protein